MNFDGRSIVAPEITTELGDGVFCAEAEPLNTGPNSATSSPMRRFVAVVLFNHGAARRVSVSACAGRDTRRSDPVGLTLQPLRTDQTGGTSLRRSSVAIAGARKMSMSRAWTASVPRMPDSSNPSHVAE